MMMGASYLTQCNVLCGWNMDIINIQEHSCYSNFNRLIIKWAWSRQTGSGRGQDKQEVGVSLIFGCIRMIEHIHVYTYTCIYGHILTSTYIHMYIFEKNFN